MLCVLFFVYFMLSLKPVRHAYTASHSTIIQLYCFKVTISVNIYCKLLIFYISFPDVLIIINGLNSLSVNVD